MIETAILFTLIGFVCGVASLFYYTNHLNKKYGRPTSTIKMEADKIYLDDEYVLCYWKSHLNPGSTAVQVCKNDPSSFMMSDVAYFKNGTIVETYSPDKFIRKLLHEDK